MKTEFTKKQLAQPQMAEANDIIKRCVHCGLCTATCPTYALTGDERDSPRGRIYLIKDMFENNRKADPQTTFHIDRCLSCLSCVHTCPSGVDYMHLVDHARTHIERTIARPPRERLVRRILMSILPYPARMRWALKIASLARPFSGFFQRMGLSQISAMLALAPTRRIRQPQFAGPGTAATSRTRRGRVILLAGCVQQNLRPNINDSTIRFLARSGIDVEVANGAGCCGALVHHMGRPEQAIEFAKKNIDAWSKLMDRQEIDAIIINASGCGTMVKDYGHLMRNVRGYENRALEISGKARDIAEFLTESDPGPPRRWSSIRVAYHDACSLRNGQRIADEPRALLNKAGFTVVEIPEAHMCCGSAGTYNILQSATATELRDRKIANIENTKSDIVACGNIGCIAQLSSAVDIPVIHTIELLDWAYGGPVPVGLAGIESYGSEIPGPEPLPTWEIDTKLRDRSEPQKVEADQ